MLGWFGLVGIPFSFNCLPLVCPKMTPNSVQVSSRELRGAVPGAFLGASGALEVSLVRRHMYPYVYN